MKIRDVRTILLTARIPPERQHTSDLGTAQAFHGAIVVVETDEGITGYGEAKGTPQVMKAIVEHELKPILLGQDPTNVQYLWERMYNGSRLGLTLYFSRSLPLPTATGELMCAISGVDVALWDIAGKALGVPIYQMLGGPVRSRIKAYASGGHAKLGEIGDEVSRYAEKGFKAIKMRVGGRDHPRIVADGVARVREAREALGPDIQIMLDAHGSTGVAGSIKLAKALEEFDIAWYEEPAVFHDFQGLAEVRHSINIPVATGENLYTRFPFRELALARAADIWQPDLAMTGGITEMIRIAGLASSFEFPMACHSWGSALLWAANLQLAAAFPNFYIFEFGQAYNQLLFDLLTIPVQVEKDGYVEIPAGPGLGIELVPDIEQRFPFDPHLPTRRPLNMTIA